MDNNLPLLAAGKEIATAAKVNEFTGLHGTSKARADAIMKDGFKPSEGRIGKGVYFWKEQFWCERLACSWADFQARNGAYNSDSDKTKVSIAAKIVVDEQFFLDLENETLKNRVALFAHQCGAQRVEDVTKVFSQVISEFERRVGHEIKVLQCKVAPPPKEHAPYYSLMALGRPLCLIVKNADCIDMQSAKVKRC